MFNWGHAIESVPIRVIAGPKWWEELCGLAMLSIQDSSCANRARRISPWKYGSTAADARTKTMALAIFSPRNTPTNAPSAAPENSPRDTYLIKFFGRSPLFLFPVERELLLPGPFHEVHGLNRNPILRWPQSLHRKSHRAVSQQMKEQQEQLKAPKERAGRRM